MENDTRRMGRLSVAASATPRGLAVWKKLQKIDELVRLSGGKPKYWITKKGWHEYGQERHWYENSGRRVGLKRAGEPDPF